MSGTPAGAGAIPDLLFLAPCLPCPPDRGDRLRWYHMLRFLGQRYRVHLGCFAEPGREPGHTSRIKALCYETCFVAPPQAARIRAVRAFARGLPPEPDQVLAGWIERLLRRQPIGAALACSAHMASYLPGRPCTSVIDLAGVESDLRRRAAAQRRWPLGALAQRQAAILFAHERAAALRCEHVLFASASHAALFGQLGPASGSRSSVVANGVDADYFSPHIVHRNPFGAGGRAIVFDGDMDGAGSALPAAWFAQHVFAPLHAADPSLRLCVAAARPDARLRALARLPGVAVTGAVPDLRPWLAHAALVVAPARAAVLEAMAMQQVVVAAPQSAAGLAARPGIELLVADGATEFQRQVRLALDAGGIGAIGKAARACVLREHSWPASLAPLAALFGTPAAHSARPA
ncbi:MAG: glycosyltransferase [Massilia sp.]